MVHDAQTDTFDNNWSPEIHVNEELPTVRASTGVKQFSIVMSERKYDALNKTEQLFCMFGLV